MTDAAPATDDIAAYARIEAEYAGRRCLAAEALTPNKAALFATLAVAGITSIVVTFDGYGDEGQIENIDARTGDISTELPAAAVEFAMPARDSSALERLAMPLAEAVEELVYGLLRDAHPGWENNDGAFGEFRFDVAERSITLEHNNRYTEIDTSVHQW